MGNSSWKWTGLIAGTCLAALIAALSIAMG